MSVLGSCHEGICGTCEQVVLDGDVDHRDSILTSGEQARNETMMICVSRGLLRTPHPRPLTKGSVPMTATRPGRTHPAVVAPADCWYALAPSEAVGRSLLAYRVAGLPVVVFRTTAGQAVALHDRCVHRPYPLSAGSLEGDRLTCGMCGFIYGPNGTCLSVPTQSRIPLGAAVRAYPVREEQGLVWVWPGEPGRACTACPNCPG